MPIPIFRKNSAPATGRSTLPGAGSASSRPTNVLECLKAESDRPFMGLIIIGSISGISSAALLAIINLGASTADMGIVSFRLFLMFLIGLALFIYSKRYVMNASRTVFENVASRICQREIDKLRHARLEDMEALDRSEVYSRITKELDTITHFSPVVVDAAQGAVLVAFSMFYLYWLSTMTFVLMIAAVTFGGMFFLLKQKEITRYAEQSTAKEIELFEGLSHVLDGFKEIKLSYQKNGALMRHITEVAESARCLKVKSGLASNFYFVFSQIAFYLLLGAVVFVLPRIVNTYPEVVIRSTVAILFMIGSLEHMVGVLPHVANINVAVRNIYALDEELDRIDERTQGIGLNDGVDFGGFETIGFHQTYFEYKDAAGQCLFPLGPLDLEIRTNELVFIVGGNGSGKSTFVKLLTGLYLPDSGSISVDGRSIDYAEYGNYRNLFGGVMGDFHLFDRLYGVEPVDEERLNELLAVMQLDNKTSFHDGRFTNLDLSTGQRARLALIAALMEDKPIYFLDEWAAAQDPVFRKYFYEEILAQMKAAGKTVLLVSHDDRYFGVADRILRMDYGQISQVSADQASTWIGPQTA